MYLMGVVLQRSLEYTQRDGAQVAKGIPRHTEYRIHHTQYSNRQEGVDVLYSVCLHRSLLWIRPPSAPRISSSHHGSTTFTHTRSAEQHPTRSTTTHRGGAAHVAANIKRKTHAIGLPQRASAARALSFTCAGTTLRGGRVLVPPLPRLPARHNFRGRPFGRGYRQDEHGPGCRGTPPTPRGP